MTQDDRPVYLRLRDEIAQRILDGVFADGDPLPSVRSLAADYGANPLTVAKAYHSFQDSGLIRIRRGIGMFVADGASERLRASERETFLRETWPRVHDQIRRLGLDATQLLEREPGPG